MKTLMRVLSLFLFGASLGFTNGASAENAEPRPAPFSSDETLGFIGRDEGMVAFMQPRSFRGLLVREETRVENLYYIELHSLPPADASKIDVDASVCQRAARLVLGPINEAPWTPGRSAMYENRYGKVCELQIFNKTKSADTKEYRIAVAVVHGQPHAFVAKFDHVAKDAEAEEFRYFIKSLYAANGADKKSPGKASRKPASEPSK